MSEAPVGRLTSMPTQNRNDLVSIVVQRAADLANPLERRLEGWQWGRWQLPPNIARHDRLPRLVMMLGLDGAACLVLAGRWRLIAAACAYAGALVLGVRTGWAYAFGGLFEVAALFSVRAVRIREKRAGIARFRRIRERARRP